MLDASIWRFGIGLVLVLGSATLTRADPHGVGHGHGHGHSHGGFSGGGLGGFGGAGLFYYQGPYLYGGYGYDPYGYGYGSYGYGFGWPYARSYVPWTSYAPWVEPFAFSYPVPTMPSALVQPQIVRRVLDEDDLDPPAAANGQPANAQRGFGAADEDAANAKAPRISSPASVKRAMSFLDSGDEMFHKQKFAGALERYKKSARTAPDLGAPFFRQGLALQATGKYALAVKALKHGLALDGTWPDARFRLDDLYGDGKLAKVAHLEALARSAREHPEDGDLLFLVGVLLYFDDQPGRSSAFFERAKALTVGNAAHVDAFLRRIKVLDDKRRPAGRERNRRAAADAEKEL